ncbi:MAG: ATP-binding cassette domain-containing protein [Actinomycetota bacterium]|nr:ATP-binding cassette domain-containing protein [Actinomycetota bacterium]
MHKTYGDVVALDEVSFEVADSTVLGLLGPNGSGKTTAVSILSTALRPDAGRASVRGLDVRTQAAAVRRVIGFAGQFAAVDANLSGRENLALIGRLSRLPRPAARDRASELLDGFGLSAAADRLVRTYSGGMRRRLDVAAALVHQPPVLFLDEPTTGLDPESRFALWEAIRQLVANGTTVLLTTQYLEEADALAERVVILESGRVVQVGTPAELKARIGAVVFRLGFADEAGAIQAEHILGAAGYGPEREGSIVRVSSAEGSGALVAVLRALEGTAPDPASVAVHEPTLDDVFLALTGHAASAEDRSVEAHVGAA